MKPTPRRLAAALATLAAVGALGACTLRGFAAPSWPSSSLGPVTLFDAVFYLLAALSVAGAAAVALSPNVLHSALGLLGALVGAGALYAMLSADFLAVTQFLVYVGGVLVLILFAVMLTNRIGQVNVSNVSLGTRSGVALLAALLPPLFLVAVAAPWAVRPPPPLAPTTRELGNAFLGRWLLPFELVSLLLLVTLVGAVIIARKELEPAEPAARPGDHHR
jgi:NADH-quinone oxidoreductase subunit J